MAAARAIEGGGDRLAELLGHRFARPDLLSQAITHASGAAAGGGDNERLEFLGDRVLALLVTEMLIAHFPDAAEGALAPRLNALVRRDTCAEVARRIGLDRHIRLSTAEESSGGRQKPGILADACEAAIGALYLDGGLEAARRLVFRYWEPMIGGLAETPRDAKTALQEWTQGQGMGIPHYELAGRSGPDHAPLFRVRVSVQNRLHAEGEGGSKRAAEQAAAEALLIAEKVWPAT